MILIDVFLTYIFVIKSKLIVKKSIKLNIFFTENKTKHNQLIKTI